MRITTAWIILTTIAAAGPVFGQGIDDKQAVLSTFDEILGDINSGNADDFMAHVTEDVMFLEMIPTEPPPVGREAVSTMVQALMNDFDLTWDGIETDTVIVVEDLAFHHYRGVFSTTPSAGGETSRSARRYLDIFRRQSDGSWKLYQHILEPLVAGQ